MNERTVPSPAPLANRLSAIGTVPNISAYIGTPTAVAIGTEYHLSAPSTFSTNSAGITLCIIAPIPTPTNIYGATFLTVSNTFSFAKDILSFVVGSSISKSTFGAFRINSSISSSILDFSIINPPITAKIKPTITYATAILVPNILIKSTSDPKSTSGDDIKNENVAPKGSPALVNPINNGIDEHEQNGVTVPKSAASILIFIPLNLSNIFFVFSGGK